MLPTTANLTVIDTYGNEVMQIDDAFFIPRIGETITDYENKSLEVIDVIYDINPDARMTRNVRLIVGD